VADEPDDQFDEPLDDDQLDDQLDDQFDDQLDDQFDEEAQAAANAQMLANARRRHGAAGAILAAGMLGLDEAMGRKPKEEIPIVVASNSDPLDIDKNGIVIDIDADRSVVAPPIPRRGERPLRKRAKRRRSA